MSLQIGIIAIVINQKAPILMGRTVRRRISEEFSYIQRKFNGSLIPLFQTHVSDTRNVDSDDIYKLVSRTAVWNIYKPKGIAGNSA